MIKWSDGFLDAMRQAGDPPADDLIATLFRDSGQASVRSLLESLVRNDQPPPEQLPPAVKDYFDQSIPVIDLPPAQVEAGQRVFVKYGPEVMLLLCFYSLPASYAARKGVQVLHRTGYLNHRPNRRLFETAQMLIDVLSVGGLDRTGVGLRSAQKVRLLHATVRHLILHDTQNPWPAEFGLPINQEDLAGTLMVFTHLILSGLDRMGLAVTEDEKQGYLSTWNIVARVMGIREELIPANVTESKILCERIQERQVEVCPEGIAMNDALLHLMEQKFPEGRSRRWPAALMRHYLPTHVADGFNLPRHHTLEFRLRTREVLTRFFFPMLERFDQRRWRNFLMHMIQQVVFSELDNKRTAFRIPTHLTELWKGRN
jgi:ER-bound oxygenase mpaB/B'/Rubber oxygenase, catalytic domain